MLLVVEEAFRARGRGVLLEPRITVEPNVATAFAVRLRELAPEDVPAGTAVHRVTS